MLTPSDGERRPSEVNGPRRSEAEIRAWLIARIADRVQDAPEAIDTGEPFVSYGIPSREAVALSGVLEEWLGRQVSPTALWEYPTIDALAQHLASDADDRPTSGGRNEATREPIALIGMGCRFPGATDPRAFWQLLSEGRDAVTEVPPDRWHLNDVYDSDPTKPGTLNTRWGGFIDQVDRFDAAFFGISPREASRMDPQQRLLLEVAWEALEDAHQAVDQLAGTKTGVFIGISTNDYGRRQFSHPSLIDAYAGTGNALSIAANRISYQFDFLGPSVAIDTACSSSLVAVHLACRSLWNGEATLALAGGVNLILSPDIAINFTKAGVMAPDGRCKAFDARANGYVRGEGAGVVVLKPLSRALADHDRIHAVILGSAVNNDGRSNGLMAPSRHAQEAVLRDAYERAGVSPGQVQYVEAHGTGTLLGDPIEAKALGSVLAADRPPGRACALGSVKTNVGHLEAAAGVAGLIKVALALEHRALPPSLHFETPNPHIPFVDLPLRVQQTFAEWPADNGQRIAGVSSFGFGGTNAHVVLSDAPLSAVRQEDREPSLDTAYVLPLSARSRDALRDVAQRATDVLRRMGDANESVRDMCYTAAVRRSHLEHRLALTARTRREFIEQLERYLADDAQPSVASGRASGSRRQVVFVFPGQGSQWVGMGRQLLPQEPVFREALEACDRELRAYVGRSLVEQLTLPEESSRLDEIDVVQPALFGVQVALAALWRSWGIEPSAVVGHSMGEVAAAHVAGALTLADAARIICERSRLLKTVSGQGRMAVVDVAIDTASRAAAPFREHVSVAVESSPSSTVLSGDAIALESLLGQFEQQGVFCRLVNVDVASHSPQMDPILDRLRERLAGVRPRINTVPLYSTVTGRASNGFDLDVEYWVRNLREPVLFSTVVQQLLTGGCDAFLEVSPHPILLGAIQQGIESSARQAVVLPSLRRGEDERTAMLSSLGALYTLGRPVKWAALFTLDSRSVELASYPWQRERCWFESGNSSTLAPDVPSPRGRRAGHPLLGTYLTRADDASTHFWETELSMRSQPFIADHRLGAHVLIPATAYLEMARAAARELFGAGAVLADVEFIQPLFLRETQTVRSVQLVVSDRPGREPSFRVYSRERSDSPKGSWTLHASGAIRREHAPSPAATLQVVDVDAVRAACPHAIPGERLYSELRASGLHYGPCFQGIERVWSGQNEALGLIRVPAPLQTELVRDELHPAVLDAALHVVGAISSLAGRGGGEPYVPLRVGEVRFGSSHGTPMWSLASRVDSDAPPFVTTDVLLLDEGGEVIVDVRALTLRRLDQVDRGARPRNIDDWFFERRWELKARPRVSRLDTTAGQWIVFADRGTSAERLTSLIESQGGSCTIVRRGSTYRAGDAFEIDPADPTHAQQLIADVLGPERPACHGVVHMWNLDGDSTDPETGDFHSGLLHGCISVLHLLQAVSRVRVRTAPRLFIVTRRAQCVQGDGHPPSIVQSPAWGLARTIAQEHPEAQCTTVDLGEADSAELESLRDELIALDSEDQIALRENVRYVARLERVTIDRVASPITAPFRLEASTAGVIDSLTARPMSRRRPRAGDVEIEVEAAGVNFMDVMRILGLVPSPTDMAIWAGAECAGRVVALGEGVDGVQLGDEVIGIAPGSFASFATTSSALVAPKPDDLTTDEAATIPVAFVTAYYALHHLARLHTGERVLIHAAAGGVGLAAVQIARWKGAAIVATAGSPEKRRYLESIGVEHVFDSRTLAFGDEILARTGGEGVDVVLNSLSGEFAERSLSVLRQRGRFLEIGKRDIHENRPLSLRPFERNLSFFAIDLQQLCAEHPRKVGAMLRGLMRRFADRTLTPLPVTRFSISEGAAALRFMAQARHIGKIVLTVPPGDSSAPVVDEASPPLRGSATYLITGGLGGIGLTVAQWMVARGVRHVALVGRRGAAEGAEDAIAAMREAGARVSVFAADVADRQQMADVLTTIDSTMPALGGVVHAAGVLDDSVLVQLDRARMESVARPKIDGAWNMHALTCDRRLDFFVLFSSAASVLGSAGQGNYAAANAFLDGLAHYRRAIRLPALSINWGPWGAVGLAARRGRADRLAVRGFDTIRPEDGLEAFARLLPGDGHAQVAVMPIDWDLLDPQVKSLPLLTSLNDRGAEEAASAKQSADSASRTAILRAAGDTRHRLLQSFVREQLARVLGLAPSSIDVHRRLNLLGVDSLMAIELRNRIERELAVTLPIATLLQAPDVMELAEHLGELLSLDVSEGIAEVARTDALPPIVPDPASRFLPFPLNDIQGAYWVGRSSLLELGNVGSHFYLEFERGDLNVERLIGAWRALIARHEMLRAVVREEGTQQILEDVPEYSIAITDVRDRSDSDAQAQVAAIRARMADQVYDPTRWPLFEVRVTQLATERFRIHVSIDLLIADVWSLFILFREWRALYEHPGRRLPPLTLTFRDYVLAEASLRATPRHTRAQAYWTARLPTLRPGPDLPLACAPSSIAKPRFVRRSGRIDATAWLAMKARARKAALTPSMVLCAVFTDVLAAWSRDARFTLNVTLFQRLPLHAEVPVVVGDFTSTILLAVNGGAASLIERARQLQQQLWTDLEHREVSGVRVLRDRARQAGSSPRAAMPVVFTSTLGQEGGGALAPTAWLGDLVYGISQTPQVWLDHQVGEDGNDLVFNWDAVDALFPEGLLDAMFAAYCSRLTTLGADEGVWDAPATSLIPEADLRLHAAMNATGAPLPDVTLPVLVAAQVARRPMAPAVIAPTRQLTYTELASMASVVATWVRQQGAGRNRLVAIVMEKGWEQVVAAVGVVQAGAAYLPVEADVPTERLALLLAQGDASLVLTQSWLRDSLVWPSGLTLLAIDQIDSEPAAGAPILSREPAVDDLAYVIFTSGSTGIPKGVMMTHRAVVNTLLDINRRWGVSPADRVLALSALSFDLSVYDIFGTLAAGGTVVMPDVAARRDPGRWLAQLRETQATVWNSVPALMQLLVETAESNGMPLLDSLRLVLLSGDWIPVALPDRIRAVAPGAQVVSLGGATEAAIWSIAYPIGAVDPTWPSIPYGRPLSNQTWHVLHPDGTPCPVWVAGELYIGGAGLAQGYWKDAERTGERFVVHPQTGERLYRTGDWGRYRRDGEIEFLGRDDLQVKVQGYRIELGEIEAALSRHPDVAQALVSAHGDRMGDKRLVAYVVGRGTSPDAAALRAALQATLPAYMVPATIHVLSSLPLSANGKVDRHALLSLTPAATTDAPAPALVDTAGVGEMIEQFVARVLRLDRVDRHTDLFALGMTSIDVMRLANELERHFGFRPQIADLFTLTNVAAVASYYERHLDERRRESRVTPNPTLLDPERREAFKREQRRLRPLAGPNPPVDLPRSAGTTGEGPSMHIRRSQRTFSAEPLPLGDLAALLECLAAGREEGRVWHRYGSAGGLYPVQTYLHVRPSRVSDLAGGAYYHHPVEHVLAPLSSDVDLDRAIHAVINRPVFDRAAFSIFLVAQMNAIEPVYGERARDFALIEAGLMAQVLEEAATRHRMGLCQIGLIDFERIRTLFRLEESHRFLHSLLGGPIALGAEAWEEGAL
jgi:phthiocerol/phenolphthiocerol synthesis type-I polyketide synthase C